MEEFDEIYENDTSDECEEEPNKLRKCYIRDDTNPLEYYSDDEFCQRYRFTKGVVIDVLLPLVQAKLQKPNNRGLPISPIIQLLTALRFYGSNSFQIVHGDLRWLSQGSVCRIVKNVSIALAEQLNHFIRFPETEAGMKKNVTTFYSVAKFPSVVGCVDCTHIPISNPSGHNGEVFRCWKGYFSLNVQVICGPNMEIMDIVVRHPGSTHDSIIFDRSAARVRFETGELCGILLGDNGYPCRKYLLTPILNPSDGHEIRYNKSHKRTRNIIERVFGVWKRRFSCLHNGLRTELETSMAIICSCAVLYNIGIRHNQNYILDPNVNPDDLECDVVYCDTDTCRSQFAVRTALARSYF